MLSLLTSRAADGFTMSDDQSEELRVVVDKLANCLGKHVVSIYEDDDRGRPALWGSGLLVSAPEGSFLVSAAHVLDPLRAGRNLYLYSKPKLKMRLTGRYYLSNVPPDGTRDDDRLDVGVLKLEGVASPPYPLVDKFSLPISALLPGAVPRNRKQYLILGVPGSKIEIDVARRQVEAKLYGNLCRTVPAERYEPLGFSTDNHIVLEFNRNSVRGPKGERQTFPKTGGLSGSPVWLLWDTDGPNDPQQTPAVGILIEDCKSEQVLVATDVGFAIEMIRDGFKPK